MSDSNKVTIAEIKTLSRKAFPDASLGWNIDRQLANGTWYSEAVTTDGDVRGWGGNSRMKARRKLRDLLARLIGGGGSDA